MSKKMYISEEKAKRIALGTTVAGVLLLIFLVIVLIIQFVQIGVRNSEREKLVETEQTLTEMIEQGQNDIDFYRTYEGYYWLARQKGWK